MPHEIRGVDVENYAWLCQETSPKRWFGNMEITSNCDVTNSEHQIQMTTIWPWTKAPTMKIFCERHWVCISRNAAVQLCAAVCNQATLSIQMCLRVTMQYSMDLLPRSYGWVKIYLNSTETKFSNLLVAVDKWKHGRSFLVFATGKIQAILLSSEALNFPPKLLLLHRGNDFVHLRNVSLVREIVANREYDQRARLRDPRKFLPVNICSVNVASKHSKTLSQLQEQSE